MKRISKTDAKRRQEILGRLDKVAEELTTAHKTFLAAVTEASTPLIDTRNRYNSIVEEANGFRDDIAGAIDSYIDERSDKWREGDAASSYDEWRDAWQEELDEAELPFDFDDLREGELELTAPDKLRDLEEEVSL
jgi:hypothetical protein